MNRIARRVPIALLVVLLTSAAAGTAGTLVERFDQTYAFEGGVFRLSNVNGSVKVDVWDRPEVRLVAEKRIRSANREAAAQAMKGLRIDVSRTTEGLRVKTHYPKRTGGVLEVFDFLTGSNVDAAVEYEVTLPRSAKVAIEVVNAGVTIHGVQGGFDLETVNGGIEVKRGAGDFEASTVNGSIDAELLRVGTRPIEVSSVNGRIRLQLPSDVRANVDVATVNGRITSELPLMTAEASRRKLRGSINGGGVRIDLSTVNGSVTLAAH